MGTSMAFISISNTGFTPQDLAKGMEHISNFSKSKTEEFYSSLAQFMSPEAFEQMKRETEETMASFQKSMGLPPRERRPVIAFCETSKWLPLFEEHLCEGNITSDDELKQLYALFRAPVLSFSIFDSDVLYASYIDATQKIYNHAKPNSDGYEEYDTDRYSTDFPEFLLTLCNENEHENLREIWESENYHFADDRMHDICRLLNINTLYDSNDMPEGYQPIFGE